MNLRIPSSTAPRHHTSLLRPASATAVLMLGMLSVAAAAQGVYRIVGPDGRVSYSDQPPPTANARPAAPAVAGPAPAAGAQLPYDLRQVASRFPVVLYTSAECAPCNSGRNLLNARGVPFSEKTIGTAEDVEALKRLSGQASLPFITIGGQQIKGYSDGEWTQFLDAAGYPRQSVLPATYRRAAAVPLVAVTKAPATPAGSPTTNAAPSAQAQEPSVVAPVTNPAGIRF